MDSRRSDSAWSIRPSMRLNEPRISGMAARTHGSGAVRYRSYTASARSGSRSARASMGSLMAATGLDGSPPWVSSAKSATAAASADCTDWISHQGPAAISAQTMRASAIRGERSRDWRSSTSLASASGSPGCPRSVQ
jgi:hypothetical protein